VKLSQTQSTSCRTGVTAEGAVKEDVDDDGIVSIIIIYRILCPIHTMICRWEDDHAQLTYPTMRIGANGESLVEAQ